MPLFSSPSVVATSPAPAAATGTVYVTKTGSKYHRFDCQYLRKSSKAMSRGAARRAGYEPCKVCGGG